jgi:uncharacterized secreted protein with C-terminal beta-propeller domain
MHHRQPICQPLEARCLLAASPWIISGTDRADEIVIEVNPAKPNQLRASIDGKIIARRAVSSIKKIVIDSASGDDHILFRLTSAHGHIRTTLLGGNGNDTITGGTGKDLIRGGAGADKLEGSLGDDDLWGGVGRDQLLGEEGADDLHGEDQRDTLIGGLGDDALWGGEGSDQLSGGFDSDTLSGGDSADTLRGGADADTLTSGAGRDTLFRQEIDYWKFDRFDRSKTDTRVNQLDRVTDLAALRQTLIELAMKRWKDSFDQPTWRHWSPRGGVYAFAASGAGAAPESMGSGDSAPPNHSETNNQESGVDEADIVKTDGNYLYIVDHNELIIIDAWPADLTQVVSRTQIVTNGWISGIYLTGDRVTIVSSTWHSGRYQPPMRGGGIAFDAIWGGWWSKPQVKVTVMDVSDRATPAKVNETTYDGSLSSSRLIDNRLYLVLDSSIEAPQPQTINKNGDSYYESAATYRARLEAMSIGDLLPGYSISKPGSAASEGYLGEENLFIPDDIEDPQSMFSVILTDPAAAPGPKSTTAVVGFSGTIYASTDNLYISSQTWDSPMGIWEGDAKTNIYKFGLGIDSIPLKASGEVAGWIHNQFSMDEEGQSFRIATTTEAGGLSNNVFVMQQDGEQLEIVGGITALALTERIYSARFIGDRGYLVTFRQVDPLFTLDLSDPTNPQVAGILKVPGFSSYLHPVGEDFLIGFGRDATLDGRVQGLQASLFDVSNIADPRLVGAYKFENDDPNHPGWFWNSSGAEWDHHAFSYFPEQKILAVPILDYGWWHGNGKLAILKLDETTGFSKLGQINHEGEVLRSVRIENFLYSLGRDAVKVINLSTPGTIIATAPLSEGGA